LLGLRPARRAFLCRPASPLAQCTAGAAEENALYCMCSRPHPRPHPRPCHLPGLSSSTRRRPRSISPASPMRCTRTRSAALPAASRRLVLPPPRLNVAGAPPSVFTVSCCKCRGVDLPQAEKQRGGRRADGIFLRADVERPEFPEPRRRRVLASRPQGAPAAGQLRALNAFFLRTLFWKAP